jgi:hypothetical protein
VGKIKRSLVVTVCLILSVFSSSAHAQTVTVRGNQPGVDSCRPHPGKSLDSAWVARFVLNVLRLMFYEKEVELIPHPFPLAAI